MALLRRIGWLALIAVTLAIIVLPDTVEFAEPPATISFNRAMLHPGAAPAKEVALPHAIYPKAENAHSVRYTIAFDLPAPGENLSVFIPAINRGTILSLNGKTFFDSASHTLWTGPLIGISVLARLPMADIKSHGNELSLDVATDRYITPTYVSQVHIGPEAAFAASYKRRTFFESHVKPMFLAAHMLVAIGLLIAFLYRPRDTLISWFAGFVLVGLVVPLGTYVGFQPALRGLMPYFVAATPAFGLLSIGVALALVGQRPPRILAIATVGLTSVLFVCATIDTHLARTISAFAAVVGLVAGTVLAAAITAWGAMQRDNTAARLMLAPLVMAAWFIVRDTYVTATLPQHPFVLLTPYSRFVVLALLVVVLVRRMGLNFEQLDRSNELLNAKLAEREAELAALHRQDRLEATRLTREQERQRLTHDLHDGLSGHLASIIALSERAEAKPIEAAAREALNDLRLVIYSLDLGERDLPLALANFRERLAPQLQRLGVALDWSMANLPEISGITPGNALTVLRILQEGITNALRHGPARRISIKGGLSADGLASIVVENDGRPFIAGRGGRGLENMRRRAEQLGATLQIAALDGGTRITLLLPLQLADIEGESVAT